MRQVRRASQKLGLTEEEVKRRYQVLAQQFSLKLAWQTKVISKET
jgi:hypothetical protein